jgi:hypothetical protein
VNKVRDPILICSPLDSDAFTVKQTFSTAC